MLDSGVYMGIVTKNGSTLSITVNDKVHCLACWGLSVALLLAKFLLRPSGDALKLLLLALAHGSDILNEFISNLLDLQRACTTCQRMQKTGQSPWPHDRVTAPSTRTRFSSRRWASLLGNFLICSMIGLRASRIATLVASPSCFIVFAIALTMSAFGLVVPQRSYLQMLTGCKIGGYENMRCGSN